ncbi:MAG: ATP-binding cassette domain-containing protein [Bacteroidales bacterium]|nr:ATP-binding cassette domain-containing protein [Bacteroidales bacterium]
MIRIDTLSKSFGALVVLKDISFSFESGLVYGIVGQNGAGKTTLFRCIAGLEKYEGNVIYDLGNLKDHLGFLMTEPFFFSKITGKEYIRLLCQARGKDPGDIDQRNIFELPLDQYASTFSTGMKKKLALTALLMQENQYFILDEPFNGVDIQSNLLITDIIHTLKALGKTVIMSSHIFQTLVDTCDEILLLDKGMITKIVGKGDFSELEKEMKEVSIGNKIHSIGLK